MDSEMFNATTFERTPDSPKLEDGFIGIRIASKDLFLDELQSNLVIHGTYRFKAEFCNRFQSLSYEIAIVCVDAEKHVSEIMNLQNDGFDPIGGSYDETDPGFDETTEKSWFNTRVSLPITSPFSEAGYHIFAIIGDQKSNVLRLRRKGK